MRNLAAAPAGDQKRRRRRVSAPVVSTCTCSHPIALLQRFHRITQKRRVRVTQFISLSSPFALRDAAGRSLGGGAFATSAERSGFIPSGTSSDPETAAAAVRLSRELVSAPALTLERRNTD